MLRCAVRQRVLLSLHTRQHESFPLCKVTWTGRICPSCMQPESEVIFSSLINTVTKQAPLLLTCVVYAAAGANKIVAQPGTITGSIGVAFGKFDVSQALRDQGISVDTIAVGKNATASSLLHGFTKEQQRQVNTMIDRSAFANSKSFRLQSLPSKLGSVFELPVYRCGHTLDAIYIFYMQHYFVIIIDS